MSDELTKLLAEIEGALQKMTPGEWEEEDYIISGQSGTPIASVYQADDFPCLDYGSKSFEDAEEECAANVVGIVALHNLSPRLIELVRAEREVCSCVRLCYVRSSGEQTRAV